MTKPQGRPTIHEYRVTKYDPKLKMAFGDCTLDDWTSVSDIGAIFGGEPLATRKYLEVENAYLATALKFFECANVDSLSISQLENPSNYSTCDLTIAEGSEYSGLELAEIMRLNLREKLWCKFVSDRAYVHFGYDYYMYLGMPVICESAIAFATRVGLYVEEGRSPYLDEPTSNN